MKEINIQFRNIITDLVRHVMPTDARIDITSSLSRFYISVAWPSNDDAARRHKMSKTIAIYVSYEAEQDFTSATKQLQLQVRDRVERFLQARLAAFDPTNNSPQHVSPSVERWDITTQTIFG